MATEQTLAIIKPDAVAAGHTGQILSMVEHAHFKLRGMKMKRLSKQQAEGFYDVHREKSFFPGLVTFMTEGPVVILVLQRETAIQEWRKLMGATNPEKADEGTIRKKFAKNIERNAVHGSDSPETAAVEIPFFFSMAELL
jgi:nucleoside-diphosphate kinase